MPDITDDSLPFDALQARLLPVADLVMVLMWSRPASGTLRNTRMTVVTIYLGVAVALVALGLALLAALLATAGQAAWWIAVLALLLLAAGCADLAVYGVRQRFLLR